MWKKKISILYVVVCLSVIFITGCNRAEGEVMDQPRNKSNLEAKTEDEAEGKIEDKTEDKAEDKIEDEAESKTGDNINEEEAIMKYSRLEEIPEDFSLQDAKAAGMLVLEGMNITSGLEEWNEFLATVWSGEADEIMIAKYYELGSASHYSKEYYEEIKDDYPVLYIFHLSFDGNIYTMSHYEDEQFYSYDYDYLIERIGQLSPNAKIAEHYFALVNDSNLSYHDITWSMLSSNSSDWVDFKYVFNESISLEDYKSRKPGKYKTENELAWLILDENSEFILYRHVATSYTPIGRYYVDDKKLVLHVNDEEEYFFEIIGDGILKFIKGTYAESLIAPGTEFKYETK